MGRRIANQVHHQVSRLMRGGILQNEPIWYQPVLNFPPLPLPPRAPPQRSSYDQKPATTTQGAKPRRPRNRPVPIYYLEDDIRRQFFTDHPFEAYRPVTLVEKGDVELREENGASWKRLRQRGRNPSVEDAIQLTLNLHQVHNYSLSDAYAQSVAQFRALRSEHHIATTIAAMEAEQLGGVFGRGEIEHGFEKEKRAIATWERLDDVKEGTLASRKRWKMVADPHMGETQWSRGAAYVRLWQAGNRVDYSPVATSPVRTGSVGRLGQDDLEDDWMETVEKDVMTMNDVEVDAQPVNEEDMDLLTSQELDALVEKLVSVERPDANEQ